jgi:hypothetical protein
MGQPTQQARQNRRAYPVLPVPYFASQLFQDGVPVQTATIAYVAPGDFAHFTLPRLRQPPEPPVSPRPPRP